MSLAQLLGRPLRRDKGAEKPVSASVQSIALQAEQHREDVVQRIRAAQPSVLSRFSGQCRKRFRDHFGEPMVGSTCETAAEPTSTAFNDMGENYVLLHACCVLLNARTWSVETLQTDFVANLAEHILKEAGQGSSSGRKVDWATMLVRNIATVIRFLRDVSAGRCPPWSFFNPGNATSGELDAVCSTLCSGLDTIMLAAKDASFASSARSIPALPSRITGNSPGVYGSNDAVRDILLPILWSAEANELVTDQGDNHQSRMRSTAHVGIVPLVNSWARVFGQRDGDSTSSTTSPVWDDILVYHNDAVVNHLVTPFLLNPDGSGGNDPMRRLFQHSAFLAILRVLRLPTMTWVQFIIALGRNGYHAAAAAALCRFVSAVFAGYDNISMKEAFVIADVVVAQCGVGGSAGQWVSQVSFPNGAPQPALVSELVAALPGPSAAINAITADVADEFLALADGIQQSTTNEGQVSHRGREPSRTACLVLITYAAQPAAFCHAVITGLARHDIGLAISVFAAIRRWLYQKEVALFIFGHDGGLLVPPTKDGPVDPDIPARCTLFRKVLVGMRSRAVRGECLPLDTFIALALHLSSESANRNHDLTPTADLRPVDLVELVQLELLASVSSEEWTTVPCALLSCAAACVKYHDTLRWKYIGASIWCRSRVLDALGTLHAALPLPPQATRYAALTLQKGSTRALPLGGALVRRLVQTAINGCLTVGFFPVDATLQGASTVSYLQSLAVEFLRDDDDGCCCSSQDNNSRSSQVAGFVVVASLADCILCMAADELVAVSDSVLLPLLRSTGRPLVSATREATRHLAGVSAVVCSLGATIRTALCLLRPDEAAATFSDCVVNSTKLCQAAPLFAHLCKWAFDTAYAAFQQQQQQHDTALLRSSSFADVVSVIRDEMQQVFKVLLWCRAELEAVFTALGSTPPPALVAHEMAAQAIFSALQMELELLG